MSCSFLLMNQHKMLSPRGRTYVVTVILAGMVAVGASFKEMLTHPVGAEWFLFAALTVISGSATVKLPSIPASLSVSETFVFTSVLLFGSSAGTLTVALDGLIISLWLTRPRKELHRVLFNMAAPALAIWVASEVFFRLTGLKPLSQQEAHIEQFLLPLLIFTILYFGLNSWLIAFAVALETATSALLIWRNNFLWLSLNFLCGASVAALLTAYTRHVEPMYLGAILPLLFVLYMTYRTSMARVEDANKHLQQVNALYLSTIETLAMAIDAKDQVTHGHIRRVQAYAVGLARALGVREDSTLHAVEAASLLHDMGKLAIPEHILNKPGRLTPSEFEKMKLHAAIGADILSAIHFPYPVVPIVRHHHENWDGTGYPDGLLGTDIPIGARILSVVDCFDALTSDRPYRPALSDQEAIKILLQRRGSMYDPLVVDTFIRVHSDIGPDPVCAQPPPKVISDIARGMALVPVDSSPSVIAANPDHSERLLIFSSLLTNIPGRIGSGDIAELSWYHLRQMVPVTALALYRYDKLADELEAVALVGPNGPVQYRARTTVGHGLSGWVAASRQPILNSDPRLDFGGSVPDLSVEVSSAASLPLIIDEQLLGVLTIYSSASTAYTDQHLKLLEVLAPRLATALARSRTFDEHAAAHLWDSETGLPNNRYLREYLASSVMRGVGDSNSILLIRATPTGSRPAASRHQLKAIADGVRSSLRLGDLIFRLQDDEILCILNGADAMTANLVRLRVADALDERIAASPQLALSTATPPKDGLSLDELVLTARTELSSMDTRLIGNRQPR
jgi:putative nucleotidyltransferase with HDIG domain